MLRKLLKTIINEHQNVTFQRSKRFISLARPNGGLRQEDNSNQKANDVADLNTYLAKSEETLEKLSERLEQILEDRYDRGADVRYENGVLTVMVDRDNVYVINKQTPNKQIWFSSPLSGPKRFDLDTTGGWIDRKSQLELRRLLSDELSSLIKSKVEC